MENFTYARMTKLSTFVMVVFFLLGQIQLSAQSSNESSKTMSIFVNNYSNHKVMSISEAGEPLKKIYLLHQDISNFDKRRLVRQSKNSKIESFFMDGFFDFSIIMKKIDAYKSEGWRIVASNHTMSMGQNEYETSKEHVTYFLLER